MQDSIFNLLTEEQLRGRNTLKWNYFGPDVVPLWLAEMDFPTAPAVLDGVRACVDNEEFGYPPLGEDSLPRATADWCRQRYGWCPRPDWVRVVPDVLKGMEVVVEFLTRPESPVALPVPAYMPFFDVLHVTGRQRVEVPMVQQDSGRYLLDLDALQAAFVRGAGSVIICNPNNPLGTAFTEAELRAIVDIAARHGARVVGEPVRGIHHRERPCSLDYLETGARDGRGEPLTVLECEEHVIRRPRDERRLVEFRQPGGDCGGDFGAQR